MFKKLNIYIPFATNEIKRQLAYKGAFYLFIFISLFSAFISYYLWMAIYGGAEGNTIAGISRNEMIVYIFMTYVTACFVNNSMSDWISEDIVKGTVAMNLIKPIDYRWSLISKTVGHATCKFLVPGIFIWLGIEIYKVQYLNMGVTSISNILLYILSMLMSFMIFVLFEFCFGMIAFFTTYIFGLSMAKYALVVFLTGQLIPLSFFPDIIQRIFDFLPFSSMIYAPVMIYLGKFSGSELTFVLCRQAAWIFILYILGSIIWRKVTKRLVVLGG